MTKIATKIARALRLNGCVVYGTKLDGPGPAMRGWFALEPAGRWRWLGKTSGDLVAAHTRLEPVQGAGSTWGARDPQGGVWWPHDDLDLDADTVVAVAEVAPHLGTWHD